MKHTLIFSDVHLSVAPHDKQKMAVFVAFLRGIDAERVGRIIVLGDLFDFWFEYRHVIFSGYFDVLRAFADLRDAGVELHFVCGNHDFWAGRFLSDDLGFQVHPATLRLELAGQRVLLVHGDGIDPADHGYRIYKRIARAPFVVKAFSLLHPDWAMWLAQKVSHGSRYLFMAEDLSEGNQVKPLQAYAQAALAAGDADVVILGHSHYPVMETHPTPSGHGLYINSGDWLFHQSFVIWNGENFQLDYFDAPDPPVTASNEHPLPVRRT